MGARFLGMEEVAGSTPASSTTIFTNKGGPAGIIPSLSRADFFIQLRGDISDESIQCDPDRRKVAKTMGRTGFIPFPEG